MLFGLPLNAAAAHWGDEAYFKLHQATGYYEQYLAGHCASGKSKAFDLINQFNGNDPKELNAKVIELKIFLKDESTPVAKLESFRLSIHEMQKRLNLNHQTKWHDEVAKACKKN